MSTHDNGETRAVIEDGSGSVWTCWNDTPPTKRACGMEVVRPGKAQCWCDLETEDGQCVHATSAHSSEGSVCLSLCGRDLCPACMGRGQGIFTDSPDEFGLGVCSDCGGTGYPPPNARRPK